MKKNLSMLIAFFFFAIFCMSQNTPRKMVAMEITTSVQCTFCPGAALGADDLLSHGCFVAVMEDHNLGQGADPFANSYSEARCSYYSYTGNPTAVFDGLLRMVGGNHTSSMYSYYLPLYNQRIADSSNISMSMQVSNTGLAYKVVVTMTKVGFLSYDPMHLCFAVTQSHIPYNWEGQSVLNYVNRLMVPNQDGTVVDLTSNNPQTVTLNFNMDSSWPLGDCEFIAFVQDYSTKEIEQTIKRGVIDLSVDFTTPDTSIFRNTPITFTEATTGGYINASETYQWLFPGAIPDASTDQNPTVYYTQLGNYDVTLIVNRGGQTDSLTKTAYITVTPGGLGIQNASDNDLSISPNPNTGSFKVQFKGNFNLQITNVTGEIVYEKLNCKNEEYINLDLKSGTYFLNVGTDKNNLIKKFIVD